MKRVLLAIAVCACGPPLPPPASPPPRPADDHPLRRADEAGHTQISARGVPLATLPMMDLIGLPMSGVVDLDVDVHHLDDPSKARGKIYIACPANCRLGDDQTRLHTQWRSQPTDALAGGIQFGHLDFDSFTASIDIADGKASVKLAAVSKDVNLKLAGTLELAQPFGESHTELCLRFRQSDTLRARDAMTYAALSMTGAPLGPGGLFNIRITGLWSAPRRVPQVCDGSAPLAPVGDLAPVAAAEPTPPAVTAAPAVAAALTPPAAPNIDPAWLAAMIKQTGATRYDIDRTQLRALLESPMSFAKGARVVPAIKNGQPYGFKLYAIRPGAIAARLGFQNGDTLVMVDNTLIDSADKAIEVYTKLRNADHVDVQIERRDVVITLSYTLRD